MPIIDLNARGNGKQTILVLAHIFLLNIVNLGKVNHVAFSSKPISLQFARDRKRNTDISGNGYTPMRKLFSFVLFILIICQPFSLMAEVQVVGKVFGSPVYRAQLVATDPYDIHAELQEFFALPVLEQYFQNNAEFLEPTQEEIKQFTSFYDKQYIVELNDKKKQLEKKIIKISKKLNNPTIPGKEKDDLIAELYFLKSELEPPGHNYAMFVLPQWKLHVHLYRKYGGGRILLQQSRYEAFDAMHTWLKLQEKNGSFLFLDKSVRTKFYHYWTGFNHGSYLISDQATIEKEFLQPEWLSQDIPPTKGTSQ